MMDKQRNYLYLHLTAAFCFAGFTSLMIHGQIEFSTNLIWPTIILILVFYFTQYLLIRFFKENTLLFDIVAFLITIGWLILLRLEPHLAYRQLIWIILGCFVLITSLKILSLVSNDFILKQRTKWLLLTIFLLFVPLVFGVEVGGAKSWLELGGLRVQPAEAAKLSFLVFLASWFKENKLQTFRDSWFVWLGTFICLGLLVLQKDLGTALIFYLTFLILFFLVYGKIEGPVFGFLLLIIASSIAYNYFPHVRIRTLAWLNPWLEPDRGGYQILQSLFAFANGGIFGMGLGAGTPQLIPEAHTDFVYAVIGEQMGILGTIGVILLYLLFVYFGLKKAWSIPTFGSRILASGLIFVLIIQAFIIMGGVTKLIPLTGLPLPFMSYGGSSTLSNFAMLGVLFRLGKEKGFVPVVIRKRLQKLNKLIWIVFLALVINLSFWQVFKAQAMLENPMNPRWRSVEKVTERGTIYARDGSILAVNSATPLGRNYPLKEAAAHIVGYNSVKYGKTGLESFLNKELLAISQLRPGFLRKNRQGWHVYTTLDAQLQQLSYDLLKNKTGAVVILEVKTGNILAAVSSPTFDPNKISQGWSELRKSEKGILFNRVTQGLYPPGSVLKIITGTALLQLRPEIVNTKTSLPEFIEAGGYKIKDLVYRPQLTFTEALGYSSNVYFVKHFLPIGWEKIRLILNEKFRFEENLSTKYLPIAKANLGEVIDKADLAATIIGQGQVLVTPLHMALWTSAIANEGLMLKPRIVNKVVSFDKNLVFKKEPEVIGSVCVKKQAKEVLKGLVYTVDYGTGTRAQIPEIKIGGKTGSAENNYGRPHAWFVGVAPIDNPRIVVVTVVEHGGRGGETAAPIARTLMVKALKIIKAG